MGWSIVEGHEQYESADGGLMRIVAPAPDARYPHFKLQDRWRDRWENARNADTVEEARRLVEAISRHRIDVKALGRTEFSVDPRKRVATPWGNADGGTRYGDGVVSYHTPGHGGFKLDAARNRKVHEALRAKGGWYEEDGEWAAVAHSFPELFTSYERELADRTLRDDRPHDYVRATGRTLTPAESRTLREEQYRRLHAADWLTVSAILSDAHPGMVEVAATIGGRRDVDAAKVFLVPKDEYRNVSGMPFAIDPDRHPEMPTDPAPAPRGP
jgi:hypothetical protein